MTTAWPEAALRRLGDICEVRRGTMITEKESTPGEVPVVAGGLEPSYYHSTPNRSQAVTTVSASGANAGHIGYWDVPIWASDCTTVGPDDSGSVVGRFMFHQLKVMETRIQATLRRGAAQPHVYAKDIADLEVRLPPLEEQRRIASILDAADELRTKRQQAIELLDTLTEAIFYDMFGETGWNTWPMVPIADLVAEAKGSIRTGPFGSQLLHEEFVDEGVAVLGIDNVVQNRFVWGERRFVTEEKYEQLKRFRVFPGDVLVTIMGTCGRVAIVPPDIPKAINTKHLCCITLDRSRCVPIWLQACMMFHPEVLRRLGATHGAVMPGLNMGLIKGAEVPVPPLNVQERFAQLRDAAGQRFESANEFLNELDNLFASLQQRAFRGEL